MRIFRVRNPNRVKRFLSLMMVFLMLLSLLGTSVKLEADTTAQQEIETAADKTAEEDTEQENPKETDVPEENKETGEDHQQEELNETENGAEASEEGDANSARPSADEDALQNKEKEPQPIQSLSGGTRSLTTRVKDVVHNDDSDKIVVIQLSDTSTYETYPANPDGLRQALYYMYSNGTGAGDDYILYFGADVSLVSPNNNIVAKHIPDTVTNTDITFFALQDKIGTLVITGTYDDPINENTAAPVGAKRINATGQNWHLGTNVELRNIRYTATGLYANAHHMALRGGSYHTAATSIYGGTDSGTVTGDAQLEIYSTGTGGTTIVGGNYAGTLDGNVKTTVYNTSGNISAFYGAGRGSNLANKVTVTGNVTSEIRQIGGTNGNLGAYYGGGQYADVKGTIHNMISGKGRNSTADIKFIGASWNGNTGSDPNGDAIINEVDFSQYTGTLRRSFVGANGNSTLGILTGAYNTSTGIVTGNIKNKITAGESGTGGAIVGVNGAGDYGTRIRVQGIDDWQTAKNLAEFQVYGNVYTELTKGCYGSGRDSSDYARAAGFGGYIEGDTTIEVGTEGWAYAGQLPDDLSYKANTISGPFVGDGSRNGNGRGSTYLWDIVGGGGAISNMGSIYIKGNTKVVQHKSVARWTYGGSFGGTIEGNTTNENLGGIVHTLEGAGYDGYLVKGGESHAISRGGQVDWFLSGGGWDDNRIEGDTKVTIYGGVINAHIGGTYGATTGHTVIGNAEINIYGGDFSGVAHLGASNPPNPKRFSGGPTMYGSIEGNTKINIDYSNNQTESFHLPAGSNLSGGVPYGAEDRVYVGRNDTVTTIEMNIKAGGDGSEDALAGASIYGDGAAQTATAYNNPSTTLNRSDRIILNIDAPGSTIGDLYATNSRHNLNKDVQVNVSSAKSINGINGGSARGTTTADDFTDTIVNGAPSTEGVQNKAQIYIGGLDKDHFDVEIGSGGIKNFTSLTVDNADFYSTGAVLNGSGIASTIANTRVTNHGSRSQFGDITLENKAGFGIASTTYAAGGRLIIEGAESTLKSPSGRGNMIITDYDADGSRVSWIRNGGDGTYEHTGTWFGKHDFYRVFTFSPGINYGNAIGVTPAGFRGTNQSDGRTYIGDNTVTDGYGLALPGSFIDYEVVRPKGHITHDVEDVGTTAPVKVYGTVEKGVPAQKGILAIPAALDILPSLTFTPAPKEENESIPEYWVKGVTVTASDEGIAANNHSSEIGESEDYDPASWTSPDKEFSYLIGASYTNEAEVFGKSVLITESEAEDILNDGEDALIALMDAKGRPFFDHDMNENGNLLVDLARPLDSEEYARKHEVTYRAGVSETPNSRSLTLNVIVVKDGTEIADDRSVGLYAHDATMPIDVANALTDQQDLDTNHTKALVILNDGTTDSAVITNQGFDKVKNAVNDQTIPVYYSYTSAGTVPKTVNKNVDVVIESSVCKIGNDGYLKLEDAINTANQSPLPVVIQMLVDEYSMTAPVEIRQDILLTTASKTDLILPYRGSNEVARILLGTDLSGDTKALFGIETNGILNLAKIVLDGNGSIITAANPWIQNIGGGIELRDDAVLENYKGVGPIIDNRVAYQGDATAVILKGGKIWKNTVTIGQGILFNDTGSKVEFLSGELRDNSGNNAGGIYNKGELQMKGGSIENNIASLESDAGGVYQDGTMLVEGKVVIHHNQAGGRINNVYLPDTSVDKPYKRYIQIEEKLLSGSYIGVMTNTSPNAEDKGTENTIIAIPKDGLENMESYFNHDQLERNTDAYEAVQDNRIGEDKHIVLQEVIKGGYFKFEKLDEQIYGSDNHVDGPEIPVAGVEFKLYRCTNTDPSHQHDHMVESGTCWEEYKATSSDSQGVVDFRKIPDGEYMLVEISAPKPYLVPEGQWHIIMESRAPGEADIKITGHGIDWAGNEIVEDKVGEGSTGGGMDPEGPNPGGSQTSGPVAIPQKAGLPPPFLFWSGGAVGSGSGYWLPNIVGTEFKFTKISAEDGDSKTPLKGAEFKLYQCTGQDDPKTHTHDYLAESGSCWILKETLTSGSDGIIDFGLLPDGEYMLEESKAPQGYEQPLGQWLLSINHKAADPITITAHGFKGTGNDGTGSQSDFTEAGSHAHGMPPAFVVETSGSDKSFYLPNMKIWGLPFSGNTGIYMFLIVGGILTGCSVLGMWIRRKKRFKRVRSNITGF